MLEFEDHHFGESLSYKQYHPESLNYHEHLHRSFELIICQAGEIGLTINGSKYKLAANEIALILPYQLHQIDTPHYSQISILVFSPEFVSHFYSTIDNHSIENPILDLGADHIKLLRPGLFETDSTSLRKSALYYILYSFEQSTRLVESQEADIIIYELLNYIEVNFHKTISLGELSKALGYSETYTSKLISEKLNSSYSTLVNRARINHACFLLKSSKLPITQISEQSGFQNSRTFNRNFLRLVGATPKNYREN